MDRNTIIGLSLIFILLMVWQQMVAPSAEELAAEQHRQDSLAALVQEQPNETLMASSGIPPSTDTQESNTLDSMAAAKLEGVFGVFASSAVGQSMDVVLENEMIRVTLASKGAKIKEVALKSHKKIVLDSAGNETKVPLVLLEDPKNVVDYFIPIPGLVNGGVHTQSMFFEIADQTDKSVTFRATGKNGAFFEQKYSLPQVDEYLIDYQINSSGIPVAEGTNLNLTWINYLDKIEVNTTVEQTYGATYYKVPEDGVDNLSKRGEDKTDFDGQQVTWISNTNQFFNSTLFAKENFPAGATYIEMLNSDATDLKKCETVLQVPANQEFVMNWYVGPNEFGRMNAINSDFTDVIAFGSSILGTINRWIIRPIFTFLAGFIGSMGVVILVLTLIVKMVLYPLTYRMLYSQSKMGALKPQIENLKVRFKDDQQAQQMETMKLYREFGVNPLGGCLPMLLQMPIWIALYRFFPASIEFRQASFLWATDLSSYDVFLRLPFEVPLGFGSHVSLFTMLWALTTLIYTYYNTKDMDMSANPAMKYMQYVMPIFFLGFFNSYASGLTCYLLFSNIINIAQTLITKNIIIDKQKIQEELDAYKKKPKKKGGFQERLETALKEQQKIAAEKEANKKKK